MARKGCLVSLIIPPQTLTTSRNGKQAILIGNSVDVRGVGDAIILSGLAREVYKVFPDYYIILKTKGPKTLFENSPYIHAVEDGLIPQNIDIGRGHYIARKCRYFGIENPELKGDIHFTANEIQAAKSILEQLSGTRPVITFCCNSTDWRRDWKLEHWEQLVGMLSTKYDVYQMEERIMFDSQGGPGIRIHNTCKAARQELRGLPIRRAAAIMSLSKKHLGTNTGFMHIATCFADGQFCYMGKDPTGQEDWLYPQNNNFFEAEQPENIARRIITAWHQ